MLWHRSMTPTIEELMTPAPHTIGAEVTVEAAREMMAEFGVRHLPVRDDGRLIGVVAAADLTLAPAYRRVAEVMDSNPLVVGPLDIASDVASAMAERRLDAAVVVSGDRVVGIFTATDAARVLAATLHALEERR